MMLHVPAGRDSVGQTDSGAWVSWCPAEEEGPDLGPSRLKAGAGVKLHIWRGAPQTCQVGPGICRGVLGPEAPDRSPSTEALGMVQIWKPSDP